MVSKVVLLCFLTLLTGCPGDDEWIRIFSTYTWLVIATSIFVIAIRSLVSLAWFVWPLA